jgi:hypothetical protein
LTLVFVFVFCLLFGDKTTPCVDSKHYDNKHTCSRERERERGRERERERTNEKRKKTVKKRQILLNILIYNRLF